MNSPSTPGRFSKSAASRWSGWNGPWPNPEWTVPDPQDATVERLYRRIPEYGDRVLRVAVNTAVAPRRIVSVFFDRNAKGKP